MIITISLDDKRIRDIVSDDDIAVFIDEIYEFDNYNYHPYFVKSYVLNIAKIHDYELSESCTMLDYLDLFHEDGQAILKQKQEIEKVAKEIIKHAKKLIDAIDKLYKLVPPEKLQKILADIYSP